MNWRFSSTLSYERHKWCYAQEIDLRRLASSSWLFLHLRDEIIHFFLWEFGRVLGYVVATGLVE